MKLFKSAILAIFALSVSAGFTSCSDDDNVTEGGSTGLFFLSNSTKINIPEDGSAIELNVARHSVNDPQSVAVQFSDPSGIFSAPATVDFAGDALTTTYAITYDAASLETGESYPVSIKIDPAQASHYGVYNLDITLMTSEPWVSLGMATYTDDIFTAVYTNCPSFTYQLEMWENQKTPGLYRLENPYGEKYPWNEPGDWDTSREYYVEIDATDPDHVWIDYTETGCNWGYGSVIWISRASWYVEGGNDPDAVAAAGWCGTLKDGIITFPVNGLVWGFVDSDDDGWYNYANANGAFMIALPGVNISDYSAEIVYNGRFIDADDVTYATVSVTLGPDVESARVAAVLDNPSVDAIVAGIVADEIEYQEISASGEVSFEIAGSGLYTFVVVTYAGGEAQEVAYVNYNISGGDDASWARIGDAYVLDGWLLGLAGYDPMQYVWGVEVRENVYVKGLYRLESLYGANCPFSGFALGGNYNIIVNAVDPNYVTIEPQFTGNEIFEDGAAYISNFGYLYVEAGVYTKDQVIANGLNATCEDDFIYFPAGTCMTNFGDDTWYRSRSEGAFEIVRDEADVETASMKRVSAKSITSRAREIKNIQEHPALVPARTPSSKANLSTVMK